MQILTCGGLQVPEYAVELPKNDAIAALEVSLGWGCTGIAVTG